MFDLETHAAALRRDGCTIIRAFVDPDATRGLREACAAGCDAFTGTPDYWTPQQLLSREALARVVFSQAAADVALALLGPDAIFLPNFTMRRDARTDWHLDNAFLNDLGGVEPDARFLQCAVYLQANSDTEGGGLDVVQASHRREVFAGRHYVPAEVLRFPQRRLASSPGDLVIWDARLLHRSTPLPPVPQATKYALHWTLARHARFARPFLAHIRRRAQSAYDRGTGQDVRYAAVCGLACPGDIPPAILDDMQRHRIALVSFAQAMADSLPSDPADPARPVSTVDG